MKRVNKAPLIPRQTWLILILIGCGVGLFVLGGLAERSRSQSQTKARVLTREDVERQSQSQIKDQPLEHSEVCQAVAPDRLADALGQKLEQAWASTPNTKTEEGRVSGCSYRLQVGDGAPIGSVVIIRRQLDSVAAAEQSYRTLTSHNADTREEFKINQSQASYQRGASQLILWQDKYISTITITKPTQAEVDSRAKLEAIGGLL